MNKVWLCTGSNLGNRFEQLDKAAILLEAHAGKLIQCSSVFETEPWGKSDQAPFLNQVLIIQTTLKPLEVLQVARETEISCGRRHRTRWDAREMDVDILFYNDEIFRHPRLEIPHPHIPERRFVLEPLAEISAGKTHPVLNKTIDVLLENCTDPLDVRLYE